MSGFKMVTAIENYVSLILERKLYTTQNVTFCFVMDGILLAKIYL
jgi:hypothetical protein